MGEATDFDRWYAGYGGSIDLTALRLAFEAGGYEARQRAERMPWNAKELKGWSIVGMNHYFVGDERRLYVAMTDREVKRCIRAHGSSEAAVFMELRMQAVALAADQPAEAGGDRSGGLTPAELLRRRKESEDWAVREYPAIADAEAEAGGEG